MTKMFQRKKKQPWTETSGERWFILLSARFYRRIANVSMSQFAFAAFASMLTTDATDVKWKTRQKNSQAACVKI